jgi:hypothetical protein
VALMRDGTVYLARGRDEEELYRVLDPGGASIAEDPDFRRYLDELSGDVDAVAFGRIPRRELDREAATLLDGLGTAAAVLRARDGTIRVDFVAALAEGSDLSRVLRPSERSALASFPEADLLAVAEVRFDPKAALDLLERTEARRDIQRLEDDLRRDVGLSLRRDVVDVAGGSLAVVVRGVDRGELVVDDRRGGLYLRTQTSNARVADWDEFRFRCDLPEATVAATTTDEETARRSIDAALRDLPGDLDRMPDRGESGVWTRVLRHWLREGENVDYAISSSGGTVAAGVAGATAVPESPDRSARDAVDAGDDALVRVRADAPAILRWIEPGVDADERKYVRLAAERSHAIDLRVDRVGNTLRGGFSFGGDPDLGLLEKSARALGGVLWFAVCGAGLLGLFLTFVPTRRPRAGS